MAHHSSTNSASWYVWTAEGPPSRASLSVGWNPVTDILTFPHMWEEFPAAVDALNPSLIEGFKHLRHDMRFLFSLRGARECGSNMGLGLFPTLMKGEFHAVRKTVEAFSSGGVLDVPEGKEIVGGVSVTRDGLGKEGPDGGKCLVRVRNVEELVSKYEICLFD